MKIFGRERWRARLGRSTYHQNPRNVYRVFIHMTDSGDKRIDTFAEQAAHMREIQNYHLNKGWADIAYHYVIFQPWGTLRWARVFRGRPITYIPSAQDHYNTNSIAITVVMRPNQYLRYRTKRKIRELIRHLERDVVKHRVNVYGHGEVNQTNCPGPALRKWIRDNYR